MSLKKVVLVDGVRIPFLRSGTDYQDLMAYDLGRMAIAGLLKRNAINPAEIDRVIMGIVIQEVKTSNIARESSLAAGIPKSVPAHTVTMACISSNQAISTGVDLIRTGQAEIIVAGGTETMSDVPIRFQRVMRKKFLEATKYKSPLEFMKFFKGFKFSHLAPEAPSITEFSTNETMGQSADKLAAAFGASREDQDRFAMRSHLMAHEAYEKGYITQEVVPVVVPPRFKPVERDNGIRGDTTYEKLAKLRPAFIKPHGTITAGNASFLTDGASATLIMSEEKALALGLTPKAELLDYTYVSQDPGEELLLGPAYAAPKLLKKLGLKKEDISVWEFHEAFAGQILANLNALNSKSFMEKAGYDVFGEIPMDTFNNWGGSLSIGHPFGATGARLVTTAANRLIQEDGEYALLAACAAGGQGHAMVLKRYNK
ncbi:thiolase family protein [bacterium]|nr:MAG: thiolase family protein [bacterium]